MSTATTPEKGANSVDVAAKAPIAWKGPIIYYIAAVVVMGVFGFTGSSEPVTFRWSDAGARFPVEPNTVNPRTVAIGAGIVILLTAGWATYRAINRRKIGGWVAVIAAFGFLTSLLAYTGAGGTVQTVYLLNATIGLSTAVIFGALAGVVGERVGVVNIAIEGQLLMGAFTAAVLASITGNLWVGLLGAMFGGALVSLVLSVFAIKYLVDQIIIGVVLNVLVLGLTNFLYSALLAGNTSVNTPGTFRSWKIPFLGDIPVIGPALFNQNVITYIMFILVFVVWFVLFKTKLGLRIRAMGEHPLAADTVGLRVNPTRFWTVTTAGLIAGLGGAALTLGSSGSFVKNMSAGQGFIALAMVILGRWNPLYAAGAALLYGFSGAFRLWAPNTPNGSDIPSDLITMVPYVVTLLAVTVFIGKSIAPAAVGKPYIKE